jgi:hypothetical protein
MTRAKLVIDPMLLIAFLHDEDVEVRSRTERMLSNLALAAIEGLSTIKADDPLYNQARAYLSEIHALAGQKLEKM